MTGYVYVLGCDAPSGYRTYVGWTLDLERRLSEHNSGTDAGAKSTRGSEVRQLWVGCERSRGGSVTHFQCVNHRWMLFSADFV